jgi:hypothetical protein
MKVAAQVLWFVSHADHLAWRERWKKGRWVILSPTSAFRAQILRQDELFRQADARWAQNHGDPFQTAASSSSSRSGHSSCPRSGLEHRRCERQLKLASGEPDFQVLSQFGREYDAAQGSTTMILLFVAFVCSALAQVSASPDTFTAVVLTTENTQDINVFEFTSVDDGVMFDTDGDGVLEQVPWLSPGSNAAFLALDTDGDGRITSGKELVGNRTLAGSANGMDALIQMGKQMGAELAGAIANDHPLYPRLLLWHDRNHDGVSDPSELRPASEVFTGIGLGYFTGSNKPDEHGNVIRYRGFHEIRAFPGQGRAQNAKEHEERLRPWVEVALAHRQ